MKNLAIILFVSVFSISMNAQEKTVVTDGPAFKFVERTIDYGKIENGSNGERIFTFTNVGTEPLIIDQVKGSCGCTIPTKPEKPIMPGETGEIKVKYDTKRPNGFSKTVTVISNDINEPRITLRIKGIVLKKETASIIEKPKTVISNQ